MDSAKIDLIGKLVVDRWDGTICQVVETFGDGFSVKWLGEKGGPGLLSLTRVRPLVDEERVKARYGFSHQVDIFRHSVQRGDVGTVTQICDDGQLVVEFNDWDFVVSPNMVTAVRCWLPWVKAGIYLAAAGTCVVLICLLVKTVLS